MAADRYGTAIATARAIFGYALLSLFLCIVGVWTLFGFAPHVAAQAPEPLAALSEPGAFWPIFIAFVAGIGAAYALSAGIGAGSEGDGEVRVSPLAAGVLGPSALVIAFASYWPCSGEESPIWAGLRHALEMFEGVVYEPFGEVEGCPAGIPQGLQAAALFALVTVALTVALAVAYVFQHSLHRLRAFVAPQVVVFSGLDDETADAARMIRRNLTSKQKLLLFDAGPEVNRARALARELGALVLTIDVTDQEAVRGFLRARGKRGIQGLYLLSPDSAANVHAMEAFLGDGGGRAARARGRSEVPGRVVLRVDNPWHAEDWRRTQMIGNPGWLFDAVSVHELTARHVVLKLKTEHVSVDTVVIDGRTAFSLAVLSELSFEHRVDQVLREASDKGQRDWEKQPRARPFKPYSGGTPHAVLVGAQAEDTASHFRDQLQRYGISNFDEVVRVMPRMTAVQAMAELEAQGRTPALIVNDSPDHDSTFLAVRNPLWTIFDWDRRIHGVTDKPMLGRLSMVGPTLKPVPGYGLDIWDRLGSIQHQIYLLNFEGGVADPDNTERAVWDEAPDAKGLSAFARESNIRSFATFTRTVGLLDRKRKLATRLGPRGMEEVAPLDDPDEMSKLAVREHESWVRHHVEYGYKYGPVRKGKRHPDIIEWDRLSLEEKEKDVENVQTTYKLLKALGFVLTQNS